MAAPKTIDEILADAERQLATKNISTEEKKLKTEIAAIDSQQTTWYLILLGAALVWKWLGNIISATSLSPWLTRMSTWCKPFFTRIKSWIMPIWNALDKALNWVNTTLHNLLDPLRKWFDNNLLSLLKKVKETSDTLTDFVDTVYTKLFGPFYDLWTDVKALSYVVSDITRIFLPEFSRKVQGWIEDIEARTFKVIEKQREEIILTIKSTAYNLENRIKYVKDTLDYNFALVTKWKDTLDVYIDAAFVAPGKLSKEAAVWQADQYGVEQDWAKWWKAKYTPSAESQFLGLKEQEMGWLDKKIIEFVDPASPEQKEIDLIVAQTTADLWVVGALGGAERTF